MGICPICNGLEERSLKCSECGGALTENGRIMDFYDDYSPYMPIDQMKLEDGFKDDFKKETCPHLYKCMDCGHEEIQFIQE